MEIKNKVTGVVLLTVEGDTLSGADLHGADLRGANLRGANLLEANLRWADLDDADLSDADLSDADLRCADLRCANLCDANLCDANLCDANLRGADLRGADLSDADLSGADLRGVRVDIPVPVVPQLHTRMLAAIEATPSAFDMRVWHAFCGTTHCRAGWVVTLAGEAGKSLEKIVGTAIAGALITQASCPYLEETPDFYCGNEEALADIAACAALELT